MLLSGVVRRDGFFSFSAPACSALTFTWRVAQPWLTRYGETTPSSFARLEPSIPRHNLTVLEIKKSDEAQLESKLKKTEKKIKM